MSTKDYSKYSREELIKIIKNLEKQRYGLVWEDKPEEVADRCSKELPVLVEDKGKEIITDKNLPTNILIEGDNYHALYALNFTHKKKIDVIYIDPPFNTGNNDFKYNDRFVDNNDVFHHSKWLSFMHKRLKLAKTLLKPKGILFVSIDDNEFAQLKLLCDEIFGETNFRNSLVVSRVKKNIKERALVKSLNLGHGSLLFYARSEMTLITVPTKLQQKAERWHAFDAPGLRPTMEYKLFGHKPPEGRHWMYEEARAREMINYGLLRQHPKSGKPQYKLEASDITMLDTNWTDIQEGDSRWKFENGEKNVHFIKRLLSIYPDSSYTVLDFFAGSGTTAHAILDLNKQDGGNRQFILCTNNENNICTEVCYPRVKKVLKGYKNHKDENIAGLGGNLKYFKTDFVPQVLTDNDKRVLVARSTELLCLAEGTFDLVKQNKSDFAIFENPRQYTAIIYDEDAISKSKTALRKLDSKKPVSIYVFSYDHTYNEEDFEDIANVVKIKPIPEAILNVYRKIAKYRKK